MDSARSLLEQARTLENGGQHRPALDLYARILQESDAPDPALVIRIARLHLRLGAKEQAVEAYLQAAKLLQHASLLHGAIALLRRVVALDPGHAPALSLLGRLSARAGLTSDARAWFARMAERMEQSGRPEQAWDELRDHLRSRPDDAEVRRLLVERLEAHGRSAEAADERRALEAAESRVQPSAPPGTGGADPYADGLQVLGNRWSDAESFSLTSADSSTMEVLATPMDGVDRPGGEETEIAGLGPSVLEGLESTSLAPQRGDELPPASVEPLSLLQLEPSSRAGSAASGQDLVHGDDALDESSLEDLPLLGAEPDGADPVQSLRHRIEEDPLDLGARMALVESLSDRGDTGALAAALQSTHPMLAEAGRNAEAEELVRRLAELRPGDDALSVLRVEYAVHSGDAARTVAALLAFGGRLVRQSRFGRAREVFVRVLEMEPGNEEARRSFAALPSSTPFDR